MIERAIPSTGEKIPVIGLGTWQQFDVGAHSPERESLVEVLKVMILHGGRLIDSSPMYGKAEAMVGELTEASGLKDQFFYATKVWTNGRQNGISQMECSFRKMKRNTMDLLQIHNLLDWQTHLNTLHKWKAEGKIRYAGVTHYTVSAHDELERIVRSKAVDFVQFNYSVRVRNAEKSLLKACQDNGVAVIINEPFEKGNLLRAVKDKPLPEWAFDYDINNWESFFLKYILADPAVTCVIPGTSNPGHMINNTGAGEGILPDEPGRRRMIEFVESL